MLKHEQDETKGLAATSTEVDSLRNEIRDLRDDIDASIPPGAGVSTSRSTRWSWAARRCPWTLRAAPR